MTIGAAHLAAPDELVEGEARLRTLAVAEPADPRGKPLEGDLGLGHLDPAPQPGIVREEAQDVGVRAQDVGWVARERDPAERSAAFAELGPDEEGDEAGEVERVRDSRLPGLGADVVAVVEDDGAALLEGEHRPDVGGHPFERPALVDLGLRAAEDERVGDGHLRRQVAAERVVGRRLIGHRIEVLAPLRPGRLDLGGIADEGDREGLAAGGGQAGHGERRIRRIGQPIDVADLVAPARPRLVDLDRNDHPFVHRDGQRLGAAHPAEAGGERDGPPQVPPEVLAGQLSERLVGALEDPLGSDVDPGAGCHLAVHHQAGPLELPEVLPGGPRSDEVRVGDQDPRRPGVRPEDADRLA